MKTIIGFSTKQQGYGRQSLYVDVDVNGKVFKNIYAEEVFPNPQEHFDYLLTYEAFDSEDGTYYTDANGNGEYEETFDTELEAIQHFVDVEDLELPEQYIIAWQENTFVTKYHNGHKRGTTLIDDAITYDSEEEAQKVIDENEWENCFTLGLNE
jgi:hypothetical protein